MKNAFWAGKRVLITGHTGFKGSWLTLWLKSLGATIVGYAIEPPSNPSLWGLLDLQTGITHLNGEIRDLAALTKVFEETRPEIVFHLAAQSLVHPSYADPVGTYATNVMGTVNVLEGARHTPSVRVLINVTSDKCYENTDSNVAHSEDDPMGGLDPYSSSKGCAELVIAAYRASFFATGAAVVSVRAGNVIGGGDWAADRLVPDFVRSVSSGAPVRIRNPRSTRPWQHVLEPLHGYLLLAERAWENGPSCAGSWNFGPSEADAVSVQNVISTLVSLWGDSARWLGDQTSSYPPEAHFLRLNSSKAQRLLGWQPRVDLQKALDWTVEWYKGCANGAQASALCLQQIKRYEELAAK